MTDTIPQLSQEANPLTPDHLAIINDVLQSATLTNQLIEACKACGLDVEPAATTNAGQCEICRKLKQVFFPQSI